MGKENSEMNVISGDPVSANAVDDNKQDVENNLFVDLDHILKLWEQYSSGQIDVDALMDLADQIIIVPYLSLDKKCEAIANIINAVYTLPDNEVLMMRELEIYKLLYLQLAYTNITFDYEKISQYVTSDVYDLLMIAYGPAFEELCGVDYNKAVDMLRDTLNWRNLLHLADDITILSKDPESVKTNFAETLQKLEEKGDLLEDIRNLLTMNNDFR